MPFDSQEDEKSMLNTLIMERVRMTAVACGATYLDTELALRYVMATLDVEQRALPERHNALVMANGAEVTP